MPETPRSVNAEPDIRAISKSVTLGSKQTLDAMDVKVCGANKVDIDFKKFDQLMKFLLISSNDAHPT